MEVRHRKRGPGAGGPGTEAPRHKAQGPGPAPRLGAGAQAPDRGPHLPPPPGRQSPFPTKKKTTKGLSGSRLKEGGLFQPAAREALGKIP